MAYFAELDSNNIVLQVLALDNAVIENEQGQRLEQFGITFLQNLFGANTLWKQTSYNTRGGVYYIPGTGEPDPDQSKAYRKNYAGIGFYFDVERDAFIPPKPPGDNWVLDDFSCVWIETAAENSNGAGLADYS